MKHTHTVAISNTADGHILDTVYIRGTADYCQDMANSTTTPGNNLSVTVYEGLDKQPVVCTCEICTARRVITQRTSSAPSTQQQPSRTAYNIQQKGKNMQRTDIFDGQTDRYAFDFGVCSLKNGYAQVDTTQDASYFGTWASVEHLTTVTYCEGDITVKKAESIEEFRAEMESIKLWNEESGYWKGVDAGWTDEEQEPWIEAGLGHMLY